jgi:hypothetical protein
MYQPTAPIDRLPFRWHAVRYANPQTKAQGQGNAGHLMMDEPYQLGRWNKPAGYILCARPVTNRDPRHWRAAEAVTCQTCLERVAWFVERAARLNRPAARGG